MKFFSFKRNNNTNTQSTPQNIVNPCAKSEVAFNGTLSKLTSPMTLSAFFGGVNIISNSLALMKWNFKNEDDELLPKTHYLYHLFDEAKMTRFNMIKNVIKDIILWGNGFIYIERDKQTHKPLTLHYSPASKTNIYFDDLNDEIWFWNPQFTRQWDNGENYLHFYMSSINGYRGISLNTFAYNSVQLLGNTEKMVDDYYKSNGTPHGVVTPNTTAPQVGIQSDNLKELRDAWNKAMGSMNGSGTIFCPADVKYTQLSSSAKDATLVESRLFNITEISRWFNISPTLLGDLSHNAYGTISESQREFVIHTLSPYVVMIEEELSRKLIMPSRLGREYIDLDENSILATDQEKQANYFKTLTSAGIMTINEARHSLGLPPKDGADDIIIPFTNVNSNTIGEEQENTEDTQQDEIQ